MKIVIIARHFPPEISGGARRPNMLHHSLAALGHDVFVIAPRLPKGVSGLAVDHPATARSDDGIVRPPTTPDPIWRVWQRRLLLWPDPERWWANRVVRTVDAALIDFAPDLIITTSPPESTHHAGAVLSERLGCDWIADFRDSWLEQPLMAERRPGLTRAWRRWGEARIARKWIRRTALATAPTHAILSELDRLGPPRRMHLYPQLATPIPTGPRAPITTWDEAAPETIRLLHTGSFSLSDPDRTLSPVLDALDRRAAEAVHLYVAGRLSEAEAEAIKAHPRAHWLGLISTDTAQQLQTEADGLLLLAAPGTTAVPGKLSEYQNAGTPILAMGSGPWREEAHLGNQVQWESLARRKRRKRRKNNSGSVDGTTEISMMEAMTETHALLQAFEEARKI